MTDKFLNIYRAPFSLGPRKIYIRDADQNTVADFTTGPEDFNTERFRVRGYGRILHLPCREMGFENPNDMFDQVEAYLLGLMEGHEADKNKCVELLNAAWAVKEEKDVG